MKTKHTLWLNDEDVARLRAQSERTGAPMAELIRRAIAAYLQCLDMDTHRRKDSSS